MEQNISRIVSKEFTDRFRGTKERLPVGDNCPKCSQPMALLFSYSGPICSWSYGGCGYAPATSVYRFAEKKSTA